jgi:hypothetical protein
LHSLGQLGYGVRLAAFIADRDAHASWKERDTVIAEVRAF